MFEIGTKVEITGGPSLGFSGLIREKHNLRETKLYAVYINDELSKRIICDESELKLYIEDTKLSYDEAKLLCSLLY